MSTESQLRELIEAHVEIDGPDEPLALEPHELAMLAGAIEDTFGLHVHASDMTPENFGTLSRLVDFIERSSTA